MARTELIKFRVTAAEKALIVSAAGGQRVLSSWLRDICLREASSLPETTPVIERRGDVVTVVGTVPRAAARKIVNQAHRESRSLPAAQPLGGDSSSGERTASKGGETCPRWYHHRSGTYCGSCKTVPK